MFAQLPNTPEVWNAKNELSQMMEDKYNELREMGKSDNEAVGIVISEFGNLDELAESLGISKFMGQQVQPGRIFESGEAAKYIAEKSKGSLICGIGVLCFIICAVGPILGETLEEISGGKLGGGPLGVVSMFVLIAIGVGLCIVSGSIDKKWSYLKNGEYRIDQQTAEEVGRQRDNYRMTHSRRLALGVGLCVLCCVPVIVMTYSSNSDVRGSLGAVAIFLMVGCGVMLIVASSGRMKAFETVLGLNDRSTIAGSYAPAQQEKKYNSVTVTALMSVFWPTVTSVYLIYSFLTFRWWMSWVIWPIAAIIQGVVNACFGVDDRRGGQK
jgi:hypothetical protein